MKDFIKVQILIQHYKPDAKQLVSQRLLEYHGLSPHADIICKAIELDFNDVMKCETFGEIGLKPRNLPVHTSNVI